MPLRFRFDTRTLTLIGLGAVINIVAGQVNTWLRLPIFLDSIGTILVAVLTGPIAGMATGLAGNMVWGLIASPVEAAFAPVAMVIGLVAGLFARAGWFRYVWQVILAGVAMAIALTLVAIPIQIFIFGGATGAGSDVAVAYFVHVGRTLWSSVGLTILGSNIADKVISALIVWFVIRKMPKRLATTYTMLKYNRA